MRTSNRLVPASIALGLVALVAPALVAAPADAATKTWGVSVSAPGSVLANTAFTVHGAIKPGKSGKTVKLQKHAGTKWSTVATTKSKSKGAYSFTRTSPALGTTSYRVVAVKSGSYGTGHSRTFRITTKPHLGVATGYQHGCSLSSRGAVSCWGDDTYAQLGSGPAIQDSSDQSSHVAVGVRGLGNGVTQISSTADSYSTCALTSAGAVKCWGYNYYGELGNNHSGSGADSNVPVQVVGLTHGIASISQGYYHGCAVSTAGGLKCWGYNYYGELGNNQSGSGADSSVPVQVQGLTHGVKAVYAMDYATCALLTTGAVKCWGENTYDELGNGVEAGTFKSTPQQVVGLTHGVKSLNAGAYTACVVLTSGAAKCWGWGDDSGIGDGGGTSRPVPTQVTGLTHGVRSISPGYDHTCAVVGASATVKCWGYGDYGQLGVGGTPAVATTPTSTVGLGTGVKSVSAGYYFTCAVTRTNAVTCWGYNAYGEVGNNTTTDAHTPVSVLFAAATTL